MKKNIFDASEQGERFGGVHMRSQIVEHPEKARDIGSRNSLRSKPTPSGSEARSSSCVPDVFFSVFRFPLNCPVRPYKVKSDSGFLFHRLKLLRLCSLVGERFMNVWNNTSSSDCGLN